MVNLSGSGKTGWRINAVVFGVIKCRFFLPFPGKEPLMSNLQNVLDALIERRTERRNFLKSAAVGALGLAGAGLLAKEAAAVTAVAPPPPGGVDAEVLNFALNLEYLEATYYSYAVDGTDLPAHGVVTSPTSGATSGTVTIKANPKVTFTDPLIAQYAQEIAVDERSHVAYIQTVLTKLGVPFIPRPNIDLLNSFNALAMAAGLGATFDPFAGDIAFLLGGYIFEDVGVTAYKGGSKLLSNKTVLENAAGVLAVEAYHAALLRTNLSINGATVLITATMTSPAITVAQATQAISNVRANLGGPSPDSNIPSNLVTNDYGVATPKSTASGNSTSSVVVSDSNAVAFSRTPQQVLKIVYGDAAGTPGGFLPQGANGFIR